MENGNVIDDGNAIVSGNGSRSVTWESNDMISHKRKAAVSDFNRKKFIIFVVGRTGAGKSILLRGILVHSFYKTQRGLSPFHQSFLEKYDCKVGDLSVSIYHVRLIGDCKNTKEDAKYLEELLKEFRLKTERKIDLVIFCQQMFGRFEEGDVNALNFLGEFFIENVWEHSVVALTKANLIPFTVTESNDMKIEMEKVRDAMKKEMQRNYFIPHGLSKVSNNIPFIPVGYRTEKTDQSKLPCSNDSIRDIVEQCIIRCKPESASAISSIFTSQRIHTMVNSIGGSYTYRSRPSQRSGTYMVAAAFGATMGGVTGALLGAANGAILGTVVGAAFGIAACSRVDAGSGTPIYWMS